MQYNEFAFSKEYGVKKTMEARDGKRLGQDSHMDANDIMKINHFYGCPALKCKHNENRNKSSIRHPLSPAPLRGKSPIGTRLWHSWNKKSITLCRFLTSDPCSSVCGIF